MTDSQSLYRQQTNLILFALVVILVGFGLNILLAASSFLARQEFGDPYFFIKRQIIFAIIGFGALVGLSQVPYKVWERIAWPLYFFSLFLLVLVFIPPLGKKAGGASRWISLGLFTMQPSDLTKFSVILVLSRLFSSKKQIDIKMILVTLGVIAVPAVLIGIEPDFGTALHLFLATAFFLFFTGFPLRVLLTLTFASLPVAYFVIVKSPYRWERVKAFLDPMTYRFEGAYQLVASFKSFLAGGIWGKGLGEGLRRHNLQARHTDFILAIVAEDLGLWGIWLVLLLYFGLAFYALVLLSRIEDVFGRLLGTGIVAVFITQVLMNVSVTMGLIPTTGINLPLFSYGGTSLVTYMAQFGILLSITRIKKFHNH